jgi:predicted permease
VILLSVLINIVLPVFVIIGAGFIVARTKSLNAQTLSRVSLYILGPALVFSKLSKTTISGSDFAQIVAFTILGTLIVLFLSWITARLLSLDRSRESAFMLSCSFVNHGNYGLPLVLFAFGQEGLERALIYFVTGAFLANTLAVFIASRGKAKATTSLLNIFRIPMIYAIVAAFAVNATDFVVPEAILKPLNMAADATIPVMLLLLGAQLASTYLRGQVRLISLAVFVRLVGGAIVGLVVATLMGLTGVTRQACVVEHSTPTAVMTSILAMEFGTEPEFVTGAIFASTLASIITMTLLVTWVS